MQVDTWKNNFHIHYWIEKLLVINLVSKTGMHICTYSQFLHTVCQWMKYLTTTMDKQRRSLEVLSKSALNSCSSCQEMSGLSFVENYWNCVPKPICSPGQDLSFGETTGFLHILLMGRSVLLRGMQNITIYFFFSGKYLKMGKDRGLCNWFGWRVRFHYFSKVGMVQECHCLSIS